MTRSITACVLTAGCVLASFGCSTGMNSPRHQAAANTAVVPPVGTAGLGVAQPGYAAPPMQVPLPPQMPIQQVAATATPQQRVQLATYFTPSEPRQDFVPVEGQEYPRMEVVSNDSFVHRYPDEYLFDGGDRGERVRYDSGRRLGVETEDTFAEYLDHTGQQHVRASNPVAIYAPRFAAVRTMTGPEQDVTIDRLAMAKDANPGAEFHGQLAIATSNRRSKASGMRTRQRGSELDTVDAGIAVRTNERAAGNTFVLKALKRRQVQETVAFDHAYQAIRARRIQRAGAWSVKRYPVIQAVSAAAVENRASVQSQVHIHIDDEQAKGDLRIIKMADIETAVPGDVVTFTIEFENTGGKELYNVRIIDNLTPRLGFIEDSASSDLEGRVVVEENNSGSKMLIFELDGKLEGGAKGTVEFSARVR